MPGAGAGFGLFADVLGKAIAQSFANRGQMEEKLPGLENQILQGQETRQRTQEAARLAPLIRVLKEFEAKQAAAQMPFLGQEAALAWRKKIADLGHVEAQTSKLDYETGKPKIHAGAHGYLTEPPAGAPTYTPFPIDAGTQSQIDRRLEQKAEKDRQLGQRDRALNILEKYKRLGASGDKPLTQAQKQAIYRQLNTAAEQLVALRYGKSAGGMILIPGIEEGDVTHRTEALHYLIDQEARRLAEGKIELPGKPVPIPEFMKPKVEKSGSFGEWWDASKVNPANWPSAHPRQDKMQPPKETPEQRAKKAEVLKKFDDYYLGKEGINLATKLLRGSPEADIEPIPQERLQEQLNLLLLKAIAGDIQIPGDDE